MFKWISIGYIEGRVQISEKTALKAIGVLFVRKPFLWFKTRKIVEIGDLCRKYK